MENTLEEVHHAVPLVDIASVIVIAVLAGLGLMRLRQPPEIPA